MSKIIDTSEPKKAPRARFKKPAIVAGVVLVLLAAGAAVLFLAKPGLNPLSKQNTEETKDEMTTYDEATKLVAEKGVDEASRYYDQQVAKTGDQNEKVILLLDKASVAYNAGDFDAALDAAREADGIKSTSGTLSMIAQSYEAKGDKAKALEYYQKALAALVKSEVTNRQETSLKSKIKELSQ